MSTPFKVKAVYEYKSGEPDDLKFPAGTIITVIEDDDADWYTGEYTSADGEKLEGLFPRNFVERYEPAVPSRPARKAKETTQSHPLAQAEAVVQDPPASVQESVLTGNLTDTTVTEPPAQQDKRIEPQQQQQEQQQQQQQPVPNATPATSSAPATKKAPPPVVDKPSSSSFRDRIAAFNKPAAAPITPFKPVGASSNTFIKKPFVAPPPSRNSYVPPIRDIPPQTVYKREEEESRPEDSQPEIRPMPALTSIQPGISEQGDEPRPTSLKERIALLQKQQQEQAERAGQGVTKKEKPKKPPQQRVDSSEAIGEVVERQSVHPSRQSTDPTHTGYVPEDSASETRHSSERANVDTPPPPPRDLVSDTNDADDSGAADTEDAHDVSTEEEMSRLQPVRSLPRQALPDSTAHIQPQQISHQEEQDEDETEEEEDPEVRRKRQLRERMAKMSGGVGMMGMLGGPQPMGSVRRPKASRPEQAREEDPSADETLRAPSVPLMALPGLTSAPQQLQEHDEDAEADGPTPVDARVTTATQENNDYIAEGLSRKLTQRSIPASPPTRTAPPPIPSNVSAAPQSPGSRPAPPPPPPTRQPGELPLSQEASLNHEFVDETMISSPPRPRPMSVASIGAPRGMPPPPPSRHQQDVMTEQPFSAPPVPTSPPNRAPPPLPPAGHEDASEESSRRSMIRGDSAASISGNEADYDTDIALGEKHKPALKSHSRDSSIDETRLTEDEEEQSQPIRVAPVLHIAPQDFPPPPPHITESVAGTKSSVDLPRAPPPAPPTYNTGYQGDDDYDPYKYSTNPLPIRGAVDSTGFNGVPFNTSPSITRSGTERSMQFSSPREYHTPSIPPMNREVPPSSSRDTDDHSNEMASISGALPISKPSTDLQRGMSVRRSTEAPRPLNEQGFIAADVPLAEQSMWWTQENNPPPSLRGRNDILWEIESSTNQKRGGKTSVSRDVYILYQDYSQSTINATYDASEPTHVAFEQSHERPPIHARQDQLEIAHTNIGTQIAKAAEKANNSQMGEGGAHEFVASLIRSVPSALMPVGIRAYGALVYANLANASTQQFDEIRSGDIITFRNAKFAGHKGGLHQKYSQDVGKPDHVGVVIDWDGTKKKIRAWEQGNQEKGKKAKVREESYRVSDLKSGEVRVWRVMPRGYVNWGSS